MNERYVKDLMVPLADYATVNQDATLFDAVEALTQISYDLGHRNNKHRAVLVCDEQGDVMGKISQTDIIRGLEPGYKKIGKTTFHPYDTPVFMKSMMQSYNLWSDPFESICTRAREVKVIDVMQTPVEGEYVEVDAPMNQALHQLVISHHQSLLVTKQGKVIGILKLTDVFSEIAKAIHEC